MIMYSVLYFLIALFVNCSAEVVHETGINFRIEPGSETCIYETAKAGQMMEVYYQVLDGQHGDLDISFDVIDPNGVKIVSDYKKSLNSIIIDLEVDGDYAFCMGNKYSLLNSKLVFVYLLVEDKDNDEEVAVSVVGEQKEGPVLEWMGYDEDGKMYFIEIRQIADTLSRTLQHVVKSRRMLDKYGATRSRDTYVAFQDTFVVDVWSAFQICFMVSVGMLQVYMIKQLFNRPYDGVKGCI